MAHYYEREDDVENELNKNAIWAITYGDLMSYLMIFFLLMFSFSYTRNVRQQMALHSIQTMAGGKKTVDMDELFSKHGLQSIARVQFDEQKLRIIFLSPVLFDPGQAELKPESIPALRSVAKVIREIPNPVVIEGHTDNIPLSGNRYKSNWELSSARAFCVLRYLIQKEGLPPRRFSAVGYGEFKPITANDTPENRAINRRIEINVMRIE